MARLAALAVFLTVSAVAAAPVAIYRSVGTTGTALASGTGGSLLSIAASGRATFTAPLPDSIGVGDVVEYDANADGVADALAFIQARGSSTEYDAQDTQGAAPLPVASTASWAIFRAYTSLAAAVDTSWPLPLGGTANPSIDAALRPFDVFAAGGKDLVAADQQWNVACYADGPDDALVHIGTPWGTDSTHFIRVYTPVLPTEVGVTQRHQGAWGTGYQRTHALHVDDRSVWLDGLAIRQARPLDALYENRVFMFNLGQRGSDIRVSHCLGWMADGTTNFTRVFDFFDPGGNVGGLQTTVRVWDSIGITDGNGAGSSAFLANTEARLLWYNCTAVALHGGSGFLSDNPNNYGHDAGVFSPTIVNGLAYTNPGPGFYAVAGAPLLAVSYSSSSDNSIDASTTSTPLAGNYSGRVFSFVDAGDYHLREEDVGARGLGTNLSEDPLVPFADDLDGEPRPTLPTAWDIGADQYVPDSGAAADGGIRTGPYRLGCNCSLAPTPVFLAAMALLVLARRTRPGKGRKLPLA